MTIKSIPIEELVPGMFLVGVNVSWLDTPFLRHKFLIKDQGAIAKLKGSGVTLVEIDTDKGKDVEAKREPPPPPAAAPSVPAVEIPAAQVPPPAAAAPPTPPPVPQAPPQPKAPATPRPARSKIPTAPTRYEDELNHAKKIRTAARKIMREAFDSVRSGVKVDESTFTALIEHSAGSTKRNPLAMLTMLAQQPDSGELIHHSFNQMGMALLLGQKLGFEGEELERIGSAALLMDIGWIHLPRNLLRQGHAYTEEEFRQVQQHVRHSVEILQNGGFEEEVIHLVECHHERYDGSGYPEALSGDEIPTGSQVLSLVNHYESTVHGLHDSAPVIPVQALRGIYTRAGEGGHDALLAKNLISLVGIYPMSSAVELDSGERGVVVKVNWKQPLKPKVRIIYGKDRRALLSPQDVDLAVLQEAGQEMKVKEVLEPRKPGVDPRGLLVFPEG